MELPAAKVPHVSPAPASDALPSIAQPKTSDLELAIQRLSYRNPLQYGAQTPRVRQMQCDPPRAEQMGSVKPEPSQQMGD